MIGIVHIHMTAGTTLASVMKRSHGTGHCDVINTDPSSDHLTPLEFHRMLSRWYPRLDSANGHALRVYAELDSVIGEVQWVTFLRDPIERTASHYQYDVQRGGVDLPFEEWVTHAAVPDRQTQTIAGPGAGADEAIDMLARFAFVGRSDRFDECLVMMQRQLGLRDIRYRSKWAAPSNDIKRRLLADPDSVERLRGVNQHDLRLWEHFETEVYPKQQAAYGPDLEEKLGAFQRRNARMTRFRQYAHPRYLAYVLKWRLGYRRWVRKVTGDSHAG